MKDKALSARFWILLGIVFIVIGFILAHLSDTNLIHWSYGLEYVADAIFHGVGPLFLAGGIMIALVKKFKKVKNEDRLSRTVSRSGRGAQPENR